MLAYTMAGCVSAALVGTVLGLLGRWLVVPGRSAAWGLYVVALLTLLLAAREWGWIRLPLPERKRQTEKFWAHDFGFAVASAMWGFQIGLGLATRITYGGFWALVGVALVLGQPIYGAVLMVTYWLGRVLPVWVAPALVTQTEAMDLLDALSKDRSVYHRLTGAALLWSAAVVVALGRRTLGLWPLSSVAGLL